MARIVERDVAIAAGATSCQTAAEPLPGWPATNEIRTGIKIAAAAVLLENMVLSRQMLAASRTALGNRGIPMIGENRMLASHFPAVEP